MATFSGKQLSGFDNSDSAFDALIRAKAATIVVPQSDADLCGLARFLSEKKEEARKQWLIAERREESLVAYNVARIRYLAAKAMYDRCVDEGFNA